MFELPWVLKTSQVLFYFLMECYGRATNPKLLQQERQLTAARVAGIWGEEREG